MVKIEFEFTDEDFALLASGFCRQTAIPQEMKEVGGKNQLVDIMSPEDHIKQTAVKGIERLARKGWNKLTLDGNPIDETKVSHILDNL
jgi:hypothetical protein